MCIIGAGVSGLVALKTILHEEKDTPFEVKVFEKNSQIGGTWNFNPSEKTKLWKEIINNNDIDLAKQLDCYDNISPMYSSLNTNTSRDLMVFSDFLMPKNYPDFPSCQQVKDYLDNYVNHFKLIDYITFNTKVIRVVKLNDKKIDNFPMWKVITKNIITNEENEYEFDSVLIGIGRNDKPRIPNYFKELSKVYKKAKIIHSKYYQDDFEIFKDKKILVIGSGSSGVDIASRVSLTAKETYISVQKGSSLIPKYLNGLPIDFNLIRRRYYLFLPKWLQTKLANWLVNYKFPKHSIYYPFNSNPSRNHTVGLSSELALQIGFGKVKPLTPIVDYNENEIIFENNVKISPDIIILCTGYEVDYPFFDEKDKIIQIDENKKSIRPLYKVLFHVEYPNLVFLCLPMTVHPFPVVENQARLVMQVLSGKTSLPSKEEMINDNKRKEEQLIKTGIDVNKFWLREYHLEYCDKLAKLGGFYPNPLKFSNSKYLWELLFGVFYSIHYRMDGPGKLSEGEINNMLNILSKP
ncbi:hypothetical protein ABK040_011902 [Willaertia magna]